MEVGMSKQKKLTPWMMESVTKINSRPALIVLTDSERKHLSTIAGILFSDSDCEKIEIARGDFAWCRWPSPKRLNTSPLRLD
jgi:hypothetical protein